jgi:hypothetical protein
MGEYKFCPEPFVKIRIALRNVEDPKEAVRYARTLRTGARVLDKLGKTKELFDEFNSNGRRQLLKQSIEFAWSSSIEIGDDSLFAYVDIEKGRMFRLANGTASKVDLIRTKRLSERLGPDSSAPS